MHSTWLLFIWKTLQKMYIPGLEKYTFNHKLPTNDQYSIRYQYTVLFLVYKTSTRTNFSLYWHSLTNVKICLFYWKSCLNSLKCSSVIFVITLEESTSVSPHLSLSGFKNLKCGVDFPWFFVSVIANGVIFVINVIAVVLVLSPYSY